jgi:hypothetical protein
MPVSILYAGGSGGGGLTEADLTTLTVGRPAVDSLTVSTDGQTSFTLTATPLVTTAVHLFLNGIRQRYTTDYSVSGTTLTWASNTSLLTSDSLVAVYTKAVVGG